MESSQPVETGAMPGSSEGEAGLLYKSENDPGVAHMRDPHMAGPVETGAVPGGPGDFSDILDWRTPDPSLRPGIDEG